MYSYYKYLSIVILATFNSKYLKIIVKIRLKKKRIVFIVPSVLKPDLDLGLGQLQSPRQIRSFRARQVFLRRESSLQFVNLRVREGRPAPFLPALKVLPVILGLVHVLLSVLCNKNTKRQPPMISRREEMLQIGSSRWARNVSLETNSSYRGKSERASPNSRTNKRVRSGKDDLPRS